MTRRSVTIVNIKGLHLQAAAAIVNVAKDFESDIRLSKGDIEVNAKSILSIVALEAGLGVAINVFADGPDEEDAVRAIVGLVEAKFNEKE